MHPNTLFISWENWVPTYKRNEIKKKTGMVLDEKGNIVDKLDKNADKEDDINAGMFNTRETSGNTNANATGKIAKQYTPINQYKPTGNLVYNKDIFDKIEKKVSFA
jgi:hypothetical protein